MLDGKPVFAPPREIQEVRNAFAAYEKLEQWSPYNENHLLEVHQLLMLGLLDGLGQYRQQAYYAALASADSDAEVSEEANDGVKTKLDALDQQLLDTMREDPYVTQDNLVALSGKFLSTIQRHIRKLRQHHIERIGSDKSGYWQVKQ